ncbi:unnamed protein product [Paramecium octaurelia]|uniref:Uncharacterized protein n=1 Tax=Paramecium octaurelia TaxID=43137 RepID=A0A8S1VXF1_PAROT|nr:unnamed protein product [Paramecium octaurelia]
MSIDLRVKLIQLFKAMQDTLIFLQYQQLHTRSTTLTKFHCESRSRQEKIVGGIQVKFCREF